MTLPTSLPTQPTFYGFPVVLEQPRPRYVLPPDVPPPPGMTLEEFALWSVRVCGYQPPLLKLGQVEQTRSHLRMSPETWGIVQRVFRAQQKMD